MNILAHLSSELVSGIAWLAAWSSFYLPTIQLLTFVTCAAIALVILLLRREILVEERWALYFGWAFAVFALQCLFQIIANFYLGWGYAPRILTRTPFEAVNHIAHTAGSVSNNLLFLASARALMGHRKLPPWAWIFAAAAAAAAFIDNEFWSRLPNMMFSAVCLLSLAWAMYVNFSSARRPRFALLSVVGGGLYAEAQLFYAFSPILMTQRWAAPVIDAIRIKQNGLHTLRPTTPLHTPLDGLDSFVFGVAFLLKILLFVGALLLIMKCLLVLAPAEAKAALGPVIDGRKEYLSHDTLLRALGESVGADLAMLCFRLPGADTQQVAWWRWLREPLFPPLINPDISPTPPEDSWSVGRVLATGQEQSSPNIRKDLTAFYYPFVREMRAFVTTPIKYHGAVIGALNIEWQRERSYTATAKLRLRQLASHIAPTVDARRQLIALDQISKELRDCERLEGGLSRDNVEKILLSIQRNLNPVASGIFLAAGFEPLGVAMDRSRTLEQFSDADSIKAFVDAFHTYAQRSTRVCLLRADLIVQKCKIGRLFLAVEHDKDAIAEPTLGRDYLQRRAVASNLVETLLASARNHFEETLRQLLTSFDDSSAGLTLDLWCEKIGEACRETGIRDAVAVFANGERRTLLGFDEFGARLRNDAVSPHNDHPSDRNSDVATTAVPLSGGSTLISLKARGASATLWLRVERNGFRWELAEALPWKYFLDGLAQIADATLGRMEQAKLRSEAASQLVLLGTHVGVAGMMYHEVKHKANDVVRCAQTVADAFELNDGMFEARKRIEKLGELASMLNAEAAKLLQPLELTSNGPVPLRDIVEQIIVEQIIRFEPQLLDDISLEMRIEPEHVVAVPREVIALATKNVVSNAIKELAGRQKKTIRIEAASQGSDILLHITDTGPGVDPTKRASLFARTNTAARGFGLPLAYWALQPSKATIYLDPDSRDGWNRFTIQLPRFINENLTY